MPSLLVTVFILQLAIHLVNTVGAAAVNTLLWNLYNSLPTPTSKAFKEQKKLQAEYLVTRKQLNSISAQDQFAKWAKLSRTHDKQLENLEKKKAALDGHKAKFNSTVSALRWVSTNGLRMLIQFWYAKEPMFWLPCDRLGYDSKDWDGAEEGGANEGGRGKGKGGHTGEHGEDGGEKGVIDVYSVETYAIRDVVHLAVRGLTLGQIVVNDVKEEQSGSSRALDNKRSCQPLGPVGLTARRAGVILPRVHLALTGIQSNTAKMVSWGTIKSLLIFFGPMLLPKAIGYYRSFKQNAKKGGRPIRPVPPAVSRALGILFVIAVILLIATLPVFSEENIFTKTQSRIQIPVDVLFTRLTAIRPNGLTELDLRLREKLVSLESKLLYLKFGPDAIGNCLFCKADDRRSFYYYSMSYILTPHVFNLAVLAAVTSGMFVGEEGTMWRRFATICSVIIAVADMSYVSEYDHKLNAKATRLEDLDMFFWRSHTYRLVVLAGLDALVGWLLFLSSTNRAFVIPVSPAERLEATTKILDSARSKMSAAAVVLNTVNRDETLRGKADGYWVNESKVMGEIMAEREVVDSVNNTLQSRVNMAAIMTDADAYSKNMLDSFKSMDAAA
ncbi:hypothetical protein V492_05854 [Pseudogymnoascus sp. VKM F-4246]|nr:hypothetical protein V492_05854 [Pseudogymnoascus sp. VKM F-4246]